MPIRKKGNIKIQTSPNGSGIKRTGYTFYSYDKNSAALVFTFIDSDNDPVNLSEADVQLLLISDNGDEFPVDKDDIDVISAIRGTARYVIPESLLGYEGKITGNIYLDFEDGSHTDEGKFTFNIKRSAITDLASEFGKQYVQDFEDVKERVEQAGDSATKDIEKARSDISSSASNVQSKASEAGEDIDDLVKSTENARDEAVKTMNEIDYSSRNLLTGTSDEWEERTFTNWISDYIHLRLKDVGLQPGDIFTYAVDIDNTIDEVNTDEVRSSITFRDSNDNQLGQGSTNYISGGKKERAVSTAEIPEKTSVIRIAEFSKREGKKQKTFAIRKAMLNHGNRAAPWTPAPESVVTKSELEKIKQAIINLGGSI